MAAASRRRACALLWVHQAIILNLVLLSFVGVSALLDPAGLARSVENGAGMSTAAPADGAKADVSRLSRDLARSSAPAALAMAFLSARALWRPLAGKREALLVLVAFHSGNLAVLALQFWEEMGAGAASVATQPKVDGLPLEAGGWSPTTRMALSNLLVGIMVLVGNVIAVFACNAGLATSETTGGASDVAGEGRKQQ
mmetsp:Transcript_43473/g.138404  ORF Transcript_43473/g.138404 Transcript_43473/m.138404 type:complete len:198 (+) Transcript_43473:100-693(+)